MKKTSANLGLKQTNFVLSLMTLLCGICAIEGNLFHCLETVLPKATKYTKWGAFLPSLQ